MNPSLPQRVVDRAMADDPQAAASEWMAEWRSDLAEFVPREVVESCVVAGRFELPPVGRTQYVAMVDPSGGSSDSYALCIGHREGREGEVVIDCLRDRPPPFSPEEVTREYAELLRSYGISRVVGDRYAGEWPLEQFRKHHIAYDLSDRPASDIFRDALPLVMSGRVVLPDNPKLIQQLIALERRTGRGRDHISHPPGGHDDLAVCAMGCAVLLATKGVSSVVERFKALT